MRKTIFSFLTAKDIRIASIARLFFALSQSYLPDACPNVYGDVEPFRRKFDEDADGMYELWANDIFWTNKSANVFGAVLHGTSKRHTSVKLRVGARDSNSGAWCAFLKEVSGLLDVDYSCIHFLQDKSHNEEDEILEGVTSLDLQDWLPTVAWASCYGSVYLSLIGASKFAEASFHNIEWISDDLVCCQLTAHASDYIDNYEEFRNRQLFAKTSIGLQYFYDPMNPNKKGVVPTFNFS